MKNYSKKGKRGVSLYLALMIMTVLLALALGVSSIFLGQVKTIREMGYSVIAFYAADAGIERVLMERETPLYLDGESETLDNEAEYHINVVSGDECGANHYCVKSIGVFKETRRAIEINY